MSKRISISSSLRDRTRKLPDIVDYGMEEGSGEEEEQVTSGVKVMTMKNPDVRFVGNIFNETSTQNPLDVLTQQGSETKAFLMLLKELEQGGMLKRSQIDEILKRTDDYYLRLRKEKTPVFGVAPSIVTPPFVAPMSTPLTITPTTVTAATKVTLAPSSSVTTSGTNAYRDLIKTKIVEQLTDIRTVCTKNNNVNIIVDKIQTLLDQI